MCPQKNSINLRNALGLDDLEQTTNRLAFYEADSPVFEPHAESKPLDNFFAYYQNPTV